MDDVQALPQPVTEALENGSIVLTANQRAARTLHRAFDLRQRALGLVYWQPPAILAWDAWLESLWQRLLSEGHATELLLNSTQEHTLWRDLIAADSATASLRPIDSLAQTAADAWSLLHAYRARQRLESFPGNSDTRAFARWAAEFERRCARSRYLTRAQLPEAVRTAIASNRLALPAGILLVGFDSKTPAQTALLEAIRATNLPIDELPQPSPAPSLTLLNAPDESTELTACANWLRARLAEQPSSSIAVIVPAIEPIRAEIDRVFREILAPELNDITAPSASGPFEFSLGVPLAHTPLAATALDILRWATSPLPLDRIGALLLSPYFATGSTQPDSELLARAEFDAFFLRQQPFLRPALTLNDLFQLAAHPKRNASLPILLNHLRALRTLINHRDLTAGKRTHADWAAAIHELLAAAGWAIPTHLDSTEFQTRRKWESALDELATLDFDGPRPSFADAIAALERISTDTLFAPESRHAPVQIMGPLESAGSSFDAVWFLRANDLDWPSTPATNPLLPWLLQRELAMPGANPAHDTAHSRRITERIAASAPTVLFSYARESADSHQRPSPILATLSLAPLHSSEIEPAAPTRTLIALDASLDDAPIPPPPDRVLPGGAAILQAQAACSFRAFAEKRLFASALDSASLGLDARERGSLVHSVLERFWTVVETQSALKHMTTAARDALLARSVDTALAEDHARPEPGWPAAYVEAERQRLINLLRPWLDYEAKKRSPFAVKSREEKLSDVSIGPLRLDIRVDRVDLALNAAAPDANEPAGEIILDYKTGLAKPADWLGPRPDAPQLPLYAVVSDTPHLAAVAFANVRPGKDMGLNGYEARSGILPKSSRLMTDSLSAQVDEWREVLTSLAEAFHAGEASVSPKQYPQTCQYCEQRLLCRLNVAALDPDLEDPDSDSDASEFSGTEADFG